MKKIISLILCFLLVFSCTVVSADQTEASGVQDVLLKVKTKITVPDELSEFSTSSRTYNEKTVYDLHWRTPDYEKYLSVTCDDKGRIQSYHNSSMEYSDKMLSSVTKKQIISYADEFIKNIIPEAFTKENDSLIFDETSYRSMGNLRYSLRFERLRNAVPVKDNYANINVFVCDDQIYVSSVNIEYNYDAIFEDEKAVAQDYVQKYKEAFPIEMVYINEYVPLSSLGKSNYEPKLIYRIKDNKPGYTDISDGSIIEEDVLNDGIRFEGAAADKAENTLASGSGAPQLTPEEIAEIENINGLLSIEEIEKNFKALPYINFPGKLKLNSKTMNKNILGEYFYRLSYSYEGKNDYRYFSVNVNAQTGEITRISNSDSTYNNSKTELSEYQLQLAQRKIKEFLNKICKEKLSETELTNTSNYSQSVNLNYVRIVNGVKFIDNGISISFDTKNNIVNSYNLNFTKGEFANPEDAVGEEKAYQNLTDYSPIEAIYILSGGKYVKAASLKKHYVTIDAMSGEVMNAEKNTEYSYTDIDDHWVLEAANKLADIQIGFNESEMKPENEITQEELLRLWMSGINGKYVAEYTQDELYKHLIDNDIILQDEKKPDASVKREDAFVYLIRMCKYEKIAKLNGIFKTDYEDADLLSEEKTGYVAILSGLGIICGDGGKIRPSDMLTRAEAIVMIYRYLLG